MFIYYVIFPKWQESHSPSGFQHLAQHTLTETQRTFTHQIIGLGQNLPNNRRFVHPFWYISMYYALENMQNRAKRLKTSSLSNSDERNGWEMFHIVCGAAETIIWDWIIKCMGLGLRAGPLVWVRFNGWLELRRRGYTKKKRARAADGSSAQKLVLGLWVFCCVDIPYKGMWLI